MPPKNGRRLTCTQCRSRKIKCDGALPGCGICRAYGKDCTYDRPPSMSHVIAMTDKIKELEKTVHELRNSPSQRSSQSPGAILGQQQTEPAPAMSEDENHSILIDPHGPLRETTSAIHVPDHIPPAILQSTNGNHDLSPQHEEQVEIPDEANWEETAIANCATILHLPPDKVRHLLATHWAWVHPTFMFIDRATFLRDAATGGDYFSPLLLTVICLHSTRFTDHDLSERLWPLVKLLISLELHEAPSVPTIAALLQLSARDIGRGSVSQSWLYSGMAFRMATDMGFFSPHAGDISTKENPNRRRIRQRLAWSCYLWDKAISLYLGRTPSLLHPPHDLPYCSVTANRYKWYPYGIPASSSAYFTAPSHAGLCFESFCNLGIIICDILMNLYGQHVTKNASEFVRSTRTRLDNWYEGLPEALKMGDSPVLCPSPHILHQNILFHASKILLLRPFRKVETCRTWCRNAANAIKELFSSMERTFGFTRVTYLMAYCAYVAATVAVQDAQDNIVGASQNVDTFIRVLSGLRATCPGIQRSLDIIKQSMQRPAAPSCDRPDSAVIASSAPVPNIIDNMPMFPFNSFLTETDFGSGLGNACFTDLDSYTYQWSDLPEDIFGDTNYDLT